MDKMDDYYLLEHFNLEEDKNEENKKIKNENNEENEETNGRYTPVENYVLISHDEFIESIN